MLSQLNYPTNYQQCACLINTCLLVVLYRLLLLHHTKTGFVKCYKKKSTQNFINSVFSAQFFFETKMVSLNSFVGGFILLQYALAMF